MLPRTRQIANPFWPTLLIVACAQSTYQASQTTEASHKQLSQGDAYTSPQELTFKQGCQKIESLFIKLMDRATYTDPNSKYKKPKEITTIIHHYAIPLIQKTDFNKIEYRINGSEETFLAGTLLYQGTVVCNFLKALNDANDIYTQYALWYMNLKKQINVDQQRHINRAHNNYCFNILEIEGRLEHTRTYFYLKRLKCITAKDQQSQAERLRITEKTKTHLAKTIQIRQHLVGRYSRNQDYGVDLASSWGLYALFHETQAKEATIAAEKRSHAEKAYKYAFESYIAKSNACLPTDDLRWHYNYNMLKRLAPILGRDADTEIMALFNRDSITQQKAHHKKKSTFFVPDQKTHIRQTTSWAAIKEKHVLCEILYDSPFFWHNPETPEQEDQKDDAYQE